MQNSNLQPRDCYPILWLSYGERLSLDNICTNYNFKNMNKESFSLFILKNVPYWRSHSPLIKWICAVVSVSDMEIRRVKAILPLVTIYYHIWYHDLYKCIYNVPSDFFFNLKASCGNMNWWSFMQYYWHILVRRSLKFTELHTSTRCY